MTKYVRFVPMVKFVTATFWLGKPFCPLPFLSDCWVTISVVMEWNGMETDMAHGLVTMVSTGRSDRVVRWWPMTMMYPPTSSPPTHSYVRPCLHTSSTACYTGLRPRGGGGGWRCVVAIGWCDGSWMWTLQRLFFSTTMGSHALSCNVNDDRQLGRLTCGGHWPHATYQRANHNDYVFSGPINWWIVDQRYDRWGNWFSVGALRHETEHTGTDRRTDQCDPDQPNGALHTTDWVLCWHAPLIPIPPAHM